MPIAETFAIGASHAALATLDSLGVVDPHSSFQPYQYYFNRGDGVRQGQGWPSAEWHWDFIPASQRSTLHGYCTSDSAALYIRMPNNEGVWHEYVCIMKWPEGQEDQFATRTLDLNIQFTHLVISES